MLDLDGVGLSLGFKNVGGTKVLAQLLNVDWR